MLVVVTSIRSHYDTAALSNDVESGIFLLFIFAPLLDIFRFDLELGHFIIFGQAWTISIESILYGDGGSIDAPLKIFSRVLLPGIAFVALILS